MGTKASKEKKPDYNTFVVNFDGEDYKNRSKRQYQCAIISIEKSGKVKPLWSELQPDDERNLNKVEDLKSLGFDAYIEPHLKVTDVTDPDVLELQKKYNALSKKQQWIFKQLI